MKQQVLLFCALFISFSTHAAIKEVHYPAVPEVMQWQVIDITFKSEKLPEKPFNIGFGAKFTNAEKESITVPGFYNGNNEWRIRFSSSFQGEWLYTTFSSIKELDGLESSIVITRNTNGLKHGSVIINKENPQQFIYEDGTPYTLMAFECDWLFALDYNNDVETPKTDHLLNLLHKNKINQVVTTVYSFDVNWEKDEKLSKYPEHEYGGKLEIYPFLGTNAKPDFSALNVEFFKKFDRIVERMNAFDIVAHLMIYVWNKQVNWPDTESEADNMYFDYIIKRYQAFPNVIWDVSKEALNNPRCTEAYGLERIERIRKLDAYKRLITVHDYGFCARNSESVDFISIQNWNSTLYTDMLNIRKKYINHPIFNIEHGGYEKSYYTVFDGDYIDPELCLRRNYLCAFAGTYHTYYWQGAAWNVIIHNPFEQNKKFIKPKFQYYKNLVAFFEKHPLGEFKPEPKNNFSSYCMTNSKGVYLSYVLKENQKLSTYYTNVLATPGGTIQWFNTLTGEYSKETECKSGLFVSPWRGEADAILIRKLEM